MKTAKTALATLALLSFGAQAGTYEFSLTNPSLTLVDLTPNDQILPSYTADASGVLGLLTPVDIHEKSAFFEGNTVFPSSTGPTSGLITGMLGPGTELIWKATGHLKISVLDTDSLWDFDSIKIDTSFYGVTDTPCCTQEFNFILSGYGGTYQRLTQEFNFGVEMHAVNYGDQPLSYSIGWDNPYKFDSYSIPRPVTAVTEPETYAMLLAGLGLIGAISRRRKTKQ